MNELNRYHDLGRRIEEGSRDDTTLREALEAVPVLTGELTLKQKRIEDLERENKQLTVMSTTDSLTGLNNQVATRLKLESILGIAAVKDHDTSILMLDIDRFKSYNDAYGHLQGDEALKTVGHVMRDAVRSSDIPCRYGGEEFLIVLPESSESVALELGEKIRRRIGNAVIPAARSVVLPDNDYRHKTVSMGVFRYHPDLSEVLRSEYAASQAKNPERDRQEFELVNAVIGAADIALYVAKLRRDCLVKYEPGMTKPEKGETPDLFDKKTLPQGS